METLLTVVIGGVIGIVGAALVVAGVIHDWSFNTGRVTWGLHWPSLLVGVLLIYAAWMVVTS